jgi:hypothetical protein
VKKYHVNLTNTSHEELRKIAINSRFGVFEGRRHTKIKTKGGEFVTEIPRHNPLNKWTARGIVEAMIAHGANIDLS